MAIYNYTDLLRSVAPKNSRFMRLNSGQISIEEYNDEEFWETTGYIQDFPTTCSSIYIGGIVSLQNPVDLLKHIINWAWKPYSAYTEIICTIRPGISTEIIPILLEYGFVPLGEPFRNLRSGNTLQHYTLRRKC